MKAIIFLLLLLQGLYGNYIFAKKKLPPHDPSLNSYSFHKKLSKAKLSSCKSHEEGSKLGIANKKEYGLDFLVKSMLAQNFSVRLNAEKVFQAKHQINVEIGKLLPMLNFATSQALANNDPFFIASQMLGFMFPSNWFRFKESKLFLRAEQWGHRVLQANQINGLLALVYQINYLKAIHAMFEEYRINLSQLLEQAIARLEHGEDRLDQKLKIENIYLKLLADQQLLEATIQKSYYQLAFVIALDEDKWNNFGIESLPLPELESKEKIRASELESCVIRNSPEIMQYRYLLAAAKYSVRARSFDFLSPFGSEETSLGFGYPSQLKIGKSYAREFEIKLEELQGNLKLAIYNVARDHNTALDAHENMLVGLENAKKWFDLLTRQFYEGGEYEAQEFLDAIASILIFHSESISIRYQFMVFNALEDRLLMRGSYYQDLTPVPESESKKLGISRKLENYRIKQAIEAGELDLQLDK